MDRDRNNLYSDASGGRSSDLVSGGRSSDLVEVLDKSVDWKQIEPLIGWVDAGREGGQQAHPPLRLLKAALVQRSLSLTPREVDFELGDRLSLRRFIELGEGEDAPNHIEINDFLQRMLEVGIADEVFEKIARQVSHSDFAANDRHQSVHYPLASDARIFRPPGWVSLEQQFFEFWEQHSRQGRPPRLSWDLISQAMTDIEPHLLSLKISENGEEYHYEIVGTEIEEGNAARLSGTSINKKLATNLTEYGHPGIQADILAICKRALEESRPVGLSSYYINAIGQRCQIWYLVAPYVDPVNEQTALVGVGMVFPNELIRAGNRHTGDSLGAPDLATLSTLARPPAHAEWSHLEGSLISYWNQARGDRKTPRLRDINLGDVDDIRANFTLIRVLGGGDDFRYELVGDDIELGNQARITGTHLAERIARNVAEYGYGGLQADLAESYNRAISGLVPTSTSRHFVNSQGHLRQLWSAQAPLSNDDGEVEMLIGVMLVKSLKAN